MLTKSNALSLGSWGSSAFSGRGLLGNALGWPFDGGGSAMVMMWGGLTRRQQSKRIIFFSKSSNLQTKVLLQGTIYPTKNELAPYYLASKERELSAL